MTECTPKRPGLPRAGLIALLLLSSTACRAAEPHPPTLDDMWAGKAHFVETNTLDWSRMAGGATSEVASWFAVDGGKWYAFNRAPIAQRNPACPADNMQTVVRVSTDEGRSWTPAVPAAVPGASLRGDGCAILDGASVYDPPSDTWHMLAQCLDLHNDGGWALCHYTRKGRSPLGQFRADPQNPVVRPGALWRPICASRATMCDPAGTHDEGTPDIVRHADGLYYVSFHGYEPQTGHGVRGMAVTPDFHSWRTSGSGLPAGPILGPVDCGRWVAKCAGVGEATTLFTARYSYVLFEAMDRSLLCTADQKWVFAAVRAPSGIWPASGDGRWQPLAGPPLIQPGKRAAGLPCPVQYARWFESLGTTWLVYDERRSAAYSSVRRLFKLVPGAGSGRLEFAERDR